jgi:hypothetical protein
MGMAHEIVPSPGKDKLGRFVPGHAGAMGNRGNYHPRTHRQKLVAATTYEEIKAVMDEVISLARSDKNVSAYRLWLEYVIGKAPQAVEVSGPAGAPLMMAVVMPILMKVLERYPDAKVELAEALEQVGLPGPEVADNAVK